MEKSELQAALNIIQKVMSHKREKINKEYDTLLEEFDKTCKWREVKKEIDKVFDEEKIKEILITNKEVLSTKEDLHNAKFSVEYNLLINSVGFIHLQMTDEEVKQKASIKKDEANALAKINSESEDIINLLHMCRFTDDVTKVLTKYNIINNNGKINYE